MTAAATITSSITKEQALSVVAGYLRPTLLASVAAQRPQDICDYGSRYFYVPETNQPIVFERHQKITLRFMFDPRFDWQTLVYSTVKKSGKTTIAALVARWIAETWGQHLEIYALANDLEQARGRIYQKFLESIELTPGYNAVKRTLLNSKNEVQWRIIEREARFLPTSTIVRAVSGDYKGEAGSNPVATLWCVSEDTDILTRRGWVPAPNLMSDDLIATLRTDRTMSYEKPHAVNKTHYTGKMVRFNSRRADFLVTPNHRVFGKFSTRGQWRFVEASEAMRYRQGQFIGNPLALANTDNTNECTIEEAMFWGYWLSEGYVSYYQYKDKKEPVYVCIAQSKKANPETYERIGKVMTSVGLQARPGHNGWSARDPELAARLCTGQGKSHERHIPDRILYANAIVQKAFLTTYLDGDGFITPTGNWQATTTSKVLADQLMIVGLHAGYHPRLMSIRERGHKPEYRLSFSTAPIAWDSRNDVWSYEDYSGMVVCPSLESGTFFARRNGKVLLQGNSELWGYNLEASLRLWEELTPVPTRKRSIRFVETYAGYEGESVLLEDLWKLATASPAHRLTHSDLSKWGYEWPFSDQPPIYINEAARVCAYIDQGEVARRMPWQTPEYYAAQASILRPNAFQRLHLNLWTSSVTAFIPPEWWDGCHIQNVFHRDAPPLDPRMPLVLAVDASVTSDCTGIVGVTRNPYKMDEVLHRFSYVWKPTSAHQMDYSQTIEPTIRELCKRYNVVEVAYDAYQLHKLMTDLRNEAVCWCRQFSQGTDRSIADKQLYDMIRDRKLVHGGDPDVREHLLNAAAKQNKEENTKLRMIKKKADSKIDLAVALSMAVYECLRLNL